MTPNSALHEAAKAENSPPVNVGATVYVARAWSHGDHRAPCPVCYGKLFVILELGNGERLPVECDGCGRGFGGPQGWVNEPQAKSSVETTRVTGFRLMGDRWRILTDGHEVEWGVEAFATEAEADARREVLYAEAVKDAAEQAYRTASAKRKSVTWTVRYHRDCLKKAQKDVEYHQRKLSDSLARQRNKVDVTDV